MTKPEIVLDTNFCLVPARRKIDVFQLLTEQGFSLIILPEVMFELENLAEKGTGSSETSRAAKATIALLRRKGIKTPPSSEGYADTAILAYCLRRGAKAATHDNKLRASLRSHQVSVITLGRAGALRTAEY
jgi:rRNA-processing protein FCF1